jgi:hypothetical protein
MDSTFTSNFNSPKKRSSDPPACSQVALSIKILKWARRKEVKETGC